LGFDAVSVGDSIVYPRRSDVKYPYTATGDRSFIEGQPFIDPIVAGAAVLTATTTLSFQSSMLKLGVRHPVVVAKQVASLAALAPGRVRLGVGSSPWPEDFTIMGLTPQRRGSRLAEAIEVVQRLLQGGYQSYSGEFYELPEARMDPTPPIPVPILIGGHGSANLRRAATLGDGWIAAGADQSRLGDMIAELHSHRRDAGRAEEAFAVHAPLHGDAGAIDHLLALGVTNIVVRPGLPGQPSTDLDAARTALAAVASALS